MERTDLHTGKDLFVRMANGDEAAFTIAFNTFYPELYSSAFRYVKTEFWAEEIVQEVFTSVWVDRSKLSLIDNPIAWLHRLTWNKAVDRMRRRGAEMKAQYALSILESADTAQDTNDRERMLSLLEAAVSQLSSQRQTIYHLRYIERLRLDQIAERLQLSRNTVRNHLSLALEKIRAYLLKHGDFLLICWLAKLLQ